jgi:hypothetical protein
MARYVLRFFFDNCAGVCLWSGNDAAHEAFDYPVDLDMLPLPDRTIEQGQGIINRFEAFLSELESPNKATAFDLFRHDSKAFLHLMREQLGPDFEILDQM